MPTNKIKERMFLVGCPRSGTTLLQSLISAHPQIASFPESKFFNALVSPGSLRYKLNLPGAKTKEILSDFLDEVDHDRISKNSFKTAFLLPQYANAFINILDLLTKEQAKTCWIEKTPAHVQRINCIEKLVSNAKFVHIIRDGEDVIASLYEVTHKHPDVWGGKRSIDQCLQRWCNDVRISLCHQHKDNHFIVRYEELVENPKLVLLKVCNFFSVVFYESMLTDYRDSSEKLIRKREQWKTSTRHKIESTRRKKFTKIFSEEEQSYILNCLAQFNQSINYLSYIEENNSATDCCLI